MIVKKVKHAKTDKTKARQITALVDYIRRPHDVNPAEKIGHSGGLNFISGTHESQRAEMISLAEETVYSKMPVTHWIFSWREHEQPTPEQVDEVVDIFLQEMGLDGCQTVYALHHNTANFHLHIAVNRMHPVTMKVVDPNHGFDLEAGHKVLALVEHRQGWMSEVNARYSVNEQGEAVLRPRRSSAPKPQQPALDFECATGEKSAQRIAQERGHAILQKAESWSELHAKLAAVGLRFERKGSGAILVVGEVAIKASSVDRAFSMGKLCKRLGEFEPGEYAAPLPVPEAEPISFINLKDWKQYKAETAQPPPQVVMGAPTMGLLKSRQQSERKNLHTRLGTGTGRQPRAVLNNARHLLKQQHREERQKLRRSLRQRDRSSRRSKRRHPRFEDWLRAQGKTYTADRWRYHAALEALPKAFRGRPTIMAAPKREPLVSYAAHRLAMLKVAPDAEPDRLNAYVALEMRKEGFSQGTVAETIFHCGQDDYADRPDSPERNWQRYAERITAAAFGIEGDIRLAQSDAAKAQQRQEQEKREYAREPEQAEAAREEETLVQAPRMRMR